MKSALSRAILFSFKESHPREGECLAEQGTASIRPSVCRGGGISETGCPLEMPRCLRPKLSIPNPEDYYFPAAVSPLFHRSQTHENINLSS